MIVEKHSRSPRKPRKPIRLSAHQLDAAIARWIDGEPLRDIAPSLGISDTTLCQQLLDHAPRAWRAAHLAHALLHYERADSPRARAKSRWHLRWALRSIAELDATMDGDMIRTPCPTCHARILVPVGRDAQCLSCSWRGSWSEARGYLLTEAQRDHQSVAPSPQIAVQHDNSRAAQRHEDAVSL